MAKSLYWSLQLKGGKKTDVLKPEIPIRISNVALARGADAEAGEQESVKVYMAFEQGEFLICTLNKNIRQVKVDLVFDDKDQVTFRTTGGLVHLSGNIELFEDDDDWESVDSNIAREGRDGSWHCEGDSDDSFDEMKEAARRLQEMKERRERGSKRARVDNYRLSHRKGNN